MISLCPLVSSCTSSTSLHTKEPGPIGQYQIFVQKLKFSDTFESSWEFQNDTLKHFIPNFFLFLFGGVKLRRQHWCFLALVLVVAVICLGVLLPMSGNTGNLNKEQQKNLIAQLLTEVPLIDG